MVNSAYSENIFSEYSHDLARGLNQDPQNVADSQQQTRSLLFRSRCDEAALAAINRGTGAGVDYLHAEESYRPLREQFPTVVLQPACRTLAQGFDRHPARMALWLL